MKKITYWLKQLFPCFYYSEYGTNGHKEVAVWRMWLGHTYDIKRWQVA